MALQLAAVSAEDMRALFDDVKGRVRGRASLAAAAQDLADVFYERWTDATVLVRTFATVPFGELPVAERMFVMDLLAARAGPRGVPDGTPVLCLLGSRGDRPEWNQRTSSRGHRAIPLAGPDFVAAIPMIARLLKELGVAVQGVEGAASLLLTRTVGTLSSIFYVEDAATGRDDLGRTIIGDQAFVRENGVRSVFASGGAYLLERSFVVAVAFVREHVPRAAAERFAPLASVFKTGTMALVDAGRFFP
jgi:hypothetical protein